MFTGINSFAAQRGAEITSILELWSRYEKYGEEYFHATDEKDEQRHFLDLLNYIDNICYIYNRRRANRAVLNSIEAIASGFLVTTATRFDIDELLRTFGANDIAFPEIEEFRRSNGALLRRKSLKLKGSIYDPLAGLDSD